MGVIFGLLLVILIITTLSVCCTKKSERVACGLCGFLVPSCIALIICIVAWGNSYSSYLDTRTFYDATREQYANSVKMYQNYALLDLTSAAAIAFTDLKYKGYQENMANFICSLRRNVIRYNKEIISKRLMKKNFFFSWMIVAPDPDMKIVKMTSEPTGAIENME